LSTINDGLKLETKISNRWGNALTAAANDGMTEIVDLLLAKVDDVPAAINRPNGFPLQAAAKAGHADLVQSLLDRGAEINRIYEGPEDGMDEGTALHAACVGNHLEIARHLLKRGADVNSGRGDWSTPLIAAAALDHQTLLQELLEHPDIAINEVGGPENATAMLYGIHHLPLQSIELLCKKGATVQITDSNGCGPCMLAAQSGRLEILQYLCEQHKDEIDLLATNDEGLMALDFALEQEDIECVRYLWTKTRPLLLRDDQQDQQSLAIRLHEADGASAEEACIETSLPDPERSHATDEMSQ
jgi:ankyrin repeat protein